MRNENFVEIENKKTVSLDSAYIHYIHNNPLTWKNIFELGTVSNPAIPLLYDALEHVSNPARPDRPATLFLVTVQLSLDLKNIVRVSHFTQTHC